MNANSVSYLRPSSIVTSIRKSSLLGLYVFLLAASLVALGLLHALGVIPFDLPKFSLWQFVFFFVLALIAEKATIRVGRAAISASFLAYFLSAVLLGPLVALVIGTVAQAVDFRRHQWSRNICFAAATGLEAGLTGLIYWAFPYYFGSSPEVQVVGGIVAGVAFQLINFVLFIPVAALRGTHRPLEWWRDAFQPFLPYHFFFLAVSLGLVWIFNRTDSLVAFVLLLLPVLGLVFSFRGYASLRNQSMENQRLAVRNERLAMQAVAALVNALDARDDYTSRHSGAVAQWATAIAADMGLSDHEVELTHLASLMHDVGKIRVPDEVLKGTGALDEIGRAQMNRHPQVGRDILAAIDDFREVAQVVLYHHERYDGAGYPIGLAGEDIPLVSRIIGVADAYSAMMMDRPYRGRLALDAAKAQLLEHKGTQFDPRVVDCFLSLLEHEGESYQRGEQADFDVEFQKVKFLRDLPPEAEPAEPRAGAAG